MKKLKKTTNYENCKNRSGGGYCTGFVTCPYRVKGFCTF